jgi:large subunit ribosomal protein L40e
LYAGTNIFEQKMQLFVKGINGRTITLDAESGSSLQSIKMLIQKSEGVSAEQQRLLHEGRQLEGNGSLSFYNLSDGTTIDLTMSLCGGSIEPSMRALANKYRCNKKVCRDCYSRLPLRATNCRKRRCGHSNKLRLKKKISDKHG